MVDPGMLFTLMFGGEQFEPFIGQLAVATIAAVAMDSGGGAKHVRAADLERWVLCINVHILRTGIRLHMKHLVSWFHMDLHRSRGHSDGDDEMRSRKSLSYVLVLDMRVFKGTFCSNGI